MMSICLLRKYKETQAGRMVSVDTVNRSATFFLETPLGAVFGLHWRPCAGRGSNPAGSKAPSAALDQIHLF
jgi:hypothetical protein